MYIVHDCMYILCSSNGCDLPFVLSSFIVSSDFKLGLYDRITGRNLDVGKSVITWNHPTEMIEVGGSSVVMVKVWVCTISIMVDIQISVALFLE